jgi:uncharacterized SAM-binding protein YcdF (DUF218 family)
MNFPAFKFFLTCVCLVSSFFFISSCSFSAKSARILLNESRSKGYDIIIVPGVPFGKGKWGRIMKKRVYWSKYLYDQGIAKNVIYSGSAVYSPYYEGEIMAMYAEAIGIPKEHVFTEIRAEHSTENIYYAYKKAKQMGFERIALASEPFQTKALRKFTRKKVSAEIGLIPMVVDSLKMIMPLVSEPVIDYPQAFDKNFISIKKKENFWKRLGGTMGKHIDTHAYDSTSSLNTK